MISVSERTKSCITTWTQKSINIQQLAQSSLSEEIISSFCVPNRRRGARAEALEGSVEASRNLRYGLLSPVKEESKYYLV